MTHEIRWWHVIALIIIIAGGLLTLWTAQQQDDQLRTDLLIKAKIAAENINPAMIGVLTGTPTDITSPDYRYLKEKLAKIRAADPSIRFAYLMGQRQQEIFFFVDSEPADSQDYSPPGQVYTEAPILIRTAFTDKKPMTGGPDSDRWGTWVSAVVPITDQETGQVVAFFGIDVDGRNWNYDIARACAAIITASLLMMVLVVTFGLLQQRGESEQRRLGASEEKFSRAFHANPTLMAILTIEEGRFLDVNPRFLETLGYSREEVIGRTISDLDLYVDPVQSDAISSQINTTGQVQNIEMKMHRKNGIMIDGLFSAITIDVTGIPRLLTVILDITERKQKDIELATKHEELMASYEQLNASEEQLKNQFDALAESERLIRLSEERLIMAEEIGHTGCWEYNAVTDKIWGSAEAQSIFGFSRDAGDLPLMDIEACIRQRERVHQALVDLISVGKEYNLEYDINPADSSAAKVIHSMARLVQDEHGDRIRVVGVIQDITERKRAETSLQRINQKLSVISQLTWKDLNNQLFVLRSYLELAKKHSAGQDQISEDIEKCNRIVAAINEITDFSKDYHELGVKPPKWQNVRTALLYGLSHISLGNIQHSIDTGDLEIFADSQLEKAFQGLFENSITHGKHASKIRVFYSMTPDGVTIFYEDDGIGIPLEKKELIFLRGESGHARVRGLFFMREILDITGITIGETGKPGEGVRFEIRVPGGAYRTD